MKTGGLVQSGASAAPQAAGQTRPSKRILVVDDDLSIRRSCARVLSCSGYQTETAEDGAAAWEALQDNDYDLLITDNRMPRVSGVELVKKVRSAHMRLPVILASGDLPAQELDGNAWLQSVATLAKPFSGDELLGTVEKVLHEADRACEQIEPPPIFSQGKFGLRAQVVSNHGCLQPPLVHQTCRSRPCD
ncbi:MAG TPA: response regulator [Candidatus Acidoferrum sp.]|nr:response regulator [Candidatus Acidoferrum sp.]